MIFPSAAAIRAVFLANGLTMGSMASHLPLLKTRLDLAESTLGVMLLVMAFGAIATMVVCGPLLDRFGSRLGLSAGAAVMVASLPILALGSNPAIIFAAFLFLGAGNGLMDVAMNAHGAGIEQKLGRSIMSSLHGFFSLGGMCAAGWTAAALSMGAAGLIILLATAIFCVLLILLVWPSLLPAEQEGLQTGGAQLAWPAKAVMPIALLALAAFVGEGAMFDWAAIFLQEVRLAEPATAAWGFGIFSAMMAAARFAGDRIIDRSSPGHVLQVSAGTAILGYGLLLVPVSASISVIGLALIGLGVANIVPILFAAAGRIKGRGTAIASVATFGYGGALAGPALVGFLAQATSLTFALAVPGTLLVLLLLFAKNLKS